MKKNVIPLLLLVAACASQPPAPETGSAAPCLPRFPYEGGWMGADAAYSVPLSPKKSVWLFGDSFVRADLRETRQGAAMVPNSVAISVCDRGAWSISYHWQDRAGPVPAPFFAAPGKGKLWPKDGFLHKGRLHMFLFNVITYAPGETFGFKGTATWLASVSNPLDAPEDWQVEMTPVMDSEVMFPGASVVTDTAHAYLFTVLDDAAHARDHPVVLLRAPLDSFPKIADSLEYLAKDGIWKKGADWQDAKIVLTPAQSEFTVHRRPDAEGWVAVMSEPVFPSGRIVVKYSSRLEGPWTAGRPVYTLPEMTPGHSAYDKDTFCYAGKEHVQFRDDRSGGLVVTYACNSFDFGKLVTNLGIYRPAAVRVSP